MKRTQWLDHGDHPAVKANGMLLTPVGDVLVRSGDWIVEDEHGFWLGAPDPGIPFKQIIDGK